jgi:acylphosphatase
MDQKLLYRIVVKGHVQGVGFRWSASKEAINRDINGFARNSSDGSVYIEAEGKKEQLDSFVEWCKKGPRLSIVESVTVNVYPAVNYTEFRIEH